MTIILIGILLFISGRLTLTETPDIITWCISALIYFVGFHWLYAYFTNSKMFAPYVIFKAESKSGRNRYFRATLMLLGGVICVSAISN